MNRIEEVLRHGPVIGVVCGSGQVTSVAAKSDADILFVLNAGFYRSGMGIGSLASFMPFGNANDQTETILKQFVLPQAPIAPVVAGVMASDPTQDIHDRLKRLRNLGVHGIANWPSLGAADGRFREAIEAEEFTVADEAAMLATAREMGFYSFGFAYTAADARVFARSGVDAVVIVVGLTKAFTDTFERRDQVQQNLKQLNHILDGVRKERPGVKCFVIGDALSTPEDIEQLRRQALIDGFVGGSTFDRLPVESIISTTIRRFKGALSSFSQKESGLGQILGCSPKMVELFGLIKRVAPHDVNICIEGESGTGKELIATQIHRLSKRSQQAFVTLNCGAIPESLLESELFGHEKGAFTGADRRRLGKFELAHRGTLFLDEIADLSPRGQVALLRVLQQGEIARVGADRYIPVDVRILAASNQSLPMLVQNGSFRSDLYHRLNHMTLIAPPLRERTEDIPLLVHDILLRLQVQLDRKIAGISALFQQKLASHVFRGNVRELQHILTRAALLEDAPVLEGGHFVAENINPPVLKSTAQLKEMKKDACKAAVRKALIDFEGNKSLAAQALGVSRKTLYAWLKELDLEAELSESLAAKK